MTFAAFNVSPSTESPSSTFVFTPATAWPPAGPLHHLHSRERCQRHRPLRRAEHPGHAPIESFFNIDAAPADLIETVDGIDTSETLLDGGNIPAGHDIRVTFTESVSVGAGWLTVTCATPVHSFSALAGSGPNTAFTVTPTSIPDGAEDCVLTVVATAVTDTDEIDQPDQMAADETRSLVSDAAPSGLSISPADNDTIGDNSDTNESIEVVFSEGVTLDAGAITFICGASVTDRNAQWTNVGATYTVTYDSLAAFHGEYCELTVVATAVHDIDGVGPETMSVNVTASFLVDEPPVFTGTLPVASPVSTTQIITLQFSESVFIADGFVMITCDAANFTAFTVSASPGTDFDITPDTAWPEDADCDITIATAGISDDDLFDTPDVPSDPVDTTFTTDAAPTVTSFNRTYPSTTEILADNDTVGSTDGIDIAFSELVYGDAGWLSITCDLESYLWTDALGFTENLSNEVNPEDFPAGATCTATVDGTRIHDTDEADDPDLVAGSPSVTFNVDAAPFVTLTSIVDEATDIDPGTNEITITFSETVTVSGATLVCDSIPFTVTTSDSGSLTATFTIQEALVPGDQCNFIIVGIDVSDADGFDAPDGMADALTINFSVSSASPPEFLSYSPSTAVENDPVEVTLTFNEAVTYDGGTVEITCSGFGSATLSLVSGNGSSALYFTAPAIYGSGVNLEGTCTATFTAGDFTSDSSGLSPTADIFVTIEGPSPG